MTLVIIKPFREKAVEGKFYDTTQLNFSHSPHNIWLVFLTACSKMIHFPHAMTSVVQTESRLGIKTSRYHYAEGLSHDDSSTSSFAIPLKLDVYSPVNTATNRPVFMFIHGGGFWWHWTGPKWWPWPITMPQEDGFLFLLITEQLRSSVMQKYRPHADKK